MFSLTIRVFFVSIFLFSCQGGKVPVDGLRIQEKLEGVHPVLFWFVFAVSTLGILMAIGFLTFNVYNQNIRYKISVFA